MTVDVLAAFVRGPLGGEVQALLRRTLDHELLEPREGLIAAGRHRLTYGGFGTSTPRWDRGAHCWPTTRASARCWTGSATACWTVSRN